MSGIFDKYFNKLNTTKNSTYSRSMPNTGKYVQTVESTEVYVPYKTRRSSSTSSEGSVGMLSRKSSVSEGAIMEEVESKTVIKTVKTAPNNRVNF